MELILENLNLVQMLIYTYWQLENKEFGGKPNLTWKFHTMQMFGNKKLIKRINGW